MLINYYNNVLESLPNTCDFHGLFTSSLAIINMVKYGSCSLNYYLTKKVIDLSTLLGIISPRNEAIVTNERDEKVDEEERKNNPISSTEEVHASAMHEIGHNIGMGHTYSRDRFDVVDKRLMRPRLTSSDRLHNDFTNPLMAYVYN